MQMSDVIADMLTRIRNANDAKHATVDIPASNMKKAIADILVEEGYRLFHLGRRNVYSCVLCIVRISDSCKHIGDYI